MDNTYFDRINTHLASKIQTMEISVAAADKAVAVVKARGMDATVLETQCNKIHNQIDLLKELLDLDVV